MSGRSSCRDTPVMRSMSMTRAAGTWRVPFSQRFHIASVTPASVATSEGDRPVALRHCLMGVVMPMNFHIGNHKSSRRISDPGIRHFRGGNYNAHMSVTRIGRKHPSQLFLREWIKKRDLLQKQVAERMEIEPGTVSKLITGQMAMTMEYLAGFADALDLSVSDLFRHPDTPTQAELLSMGTPDELRAAMRLVQMAKTGTGG